MYKIAAALLAVIVFYVPTKSFGGLRVKTYHVIKFNQIERQISEFTCGIAVLSTIFRHYYGIDLTQKQLLDRYIQSVIDEKRGISFSDMRKIARDHGFDAYAYKINYPALLEFIKEASVPIVVHLGTRASPGLVGHFSLLAGKSRGSLIIIDTAFGHTSYSRDYFLSLWTGNILVMVPEKQAANRAKLLKYSKNKLLTIRERGRSHLNRLHYEKILNY